MFNTDDLEIDYVPTIAVNSRAGNMKKITKKQTKVPVKQPSIKQNNNKNNDFDDLLDDIDFDHKKPTKIIDNKQSITNKNLFNSLEDDDDLPKPIINKKQVNNINNKSSTYKIQHSDQIINQDNNINNFGKTQQTLNNKNEQIFISSRNMKPPMRKKNESINQSISFGIVSNGINLPQDNKNINIKNEQQDIIRPPPRLMNRRSSIDNKNDQLINKNNIQNIFNKLDQNKQKQKIKQNLKLNLQIKSQIKPEIKLVNKIQQPLKINIKKQQKNINDDKLIKIQKSNINQIKKDIDLHVDQSITILRESPNGNKISNQQYQKQIQHIKSTFQKQVDFLQQNLDKQIIINRQTRDKLIKQSNKMIEDERIRVKRIQQEQIKRLKEMFQWQKHRIKQTYQLQINNLRQSLEYTQKTNNYAYKTNSITKEDIQYLSNQLKHKQKILQDRQKIIQKRQLEINEREIEFNKRRKKQDERLRQEQKRIIEYQMKIKKELLDQRKKMDQQKQQIAIQVANLQIEVIKKQQKVQYNLKQNILEKQGLDYQKYQLRNQYSQLMVKYRLQSEQVQNQKQRLKLIENDLIKKLRIVQQRMKQVPNIKYSNNRKCNNWIEVDNKNIEIQNRYINRSLNNETKDRFYQLQNNIKNKLNITIKQNNKFNLDDYILNVQEYKKIKCNNY